MVAIQRAGEEPVFPHVSAAPVQTVHVLRIQLVHALQGPRQRILALRRGDQVNMVRHQAIPLDPQRETRRRLPEVLEKYLPVRAHEENIHAIVATLRHVVGNARNHDSCISRHGFTVTVRCHFRNRK